MASSVAPYTFKFPIDHWGPPQEVFGVLEDGYACLYSKVDGELVPIFDPPKPKHPNPDNVDRIYAELLKLINVELPRYRHNRVMFKGEPQSGKSLIQFILLWQSCFVDEKGTVHLLMERIGSLLQNINRDYIELCSIVKNICTRLDIEDYENYIFDYVAFPKYAKRETEADSIHTVHVAMATAAQLRRVKGLARENRMSLVFDEADIFVKRPGGKVMNLIRDICLDAECRYEFTATPFSNFNEADQVYDLVVTIPPKQEYRGYKSDKIKYNIVSQEQLDSMDEIVQNCLQKDTGEFRNMILVNVETTIEGQHKIAENIRREHGAYVVVHELNSGSHGVKRSVDRIMNEYANSEDQRPVIIISNMMAGRAITFRTSRDNPKQCSLSSMVYSPADKATQSTLMQAQRIYGNYDDSYPVIDMYCTSDVKDAITNSFLNNEAITYSVVPGKESRTCIEKAPVKYIPGRKFSDTDDSKVKRLEKREFPNPNSVIRFVTNKFSRYTGKFRDYVITSDGLVNVPTSGTSIRQDIKDHIGISAEEHLHVAYDDKRYQELFNISRRIDVPNYKKVKYTAGDGNAIDNTVPVIKWRDGYEDVDNWNDPDIIYVFQTTKGTWKFWLPGQMNTFRKIEH
jgi:hypothetical protein